MKITPFGSNILVRPKARSTAIPVGDGQGALCEYGEVLSVGDEVKKIKVGDNVGFLVWGIQKLEVEDITYYFLPEESKFILGLIEE